MQFCTFNTEWGWFGLVASDAGLTATYLPRPEKETRRRIQRDWPDARESPTMMPLLRQQVIQYFAGKKTAFTVDLDLVRIPPFRAEVLKACRRIPHGKTASYADLARAVGNESAVRAAGGAMAKNPMPLIVPCHRVLRSDGGLGGFSSPEGVKEKQRLLELEGVIRSRPMAEVAKPDSPRRKLAAVG